MKKKTNRQILTEAGLKPREINYTLNYIHSHISYAMLYNDPADCGHNCENDFTREKADVQDDFDWGMQLCTEPEKGYILLPTGKVLAWG